jgi:hypothetical protein
VFEAEKVGKAGTDHARMLGGRVADWDQPLHHSSGAEADRPGSGAPIWRAGEQRRRLGQREVLVGGNESLDDALVGPAVLERRPPGRQSRTVDRSAQVVLIVSGDELGEALG